MKYELYINERNYIKASTSHIIAVKCYNYFKKINFSSSFSRLLPWVLSSLLSQISKTPILITRERYIWLYEDMYPRSHTQII